MPIIKRVHNIIKIVVFMGLLIVLLMFTSQLFREKQLKNILFDKYHTPIESFYAEEKDSLDVIVVGTSRTYTVMLPTELYHQYGITSFVLSTGGQQAWTSYDYICEALKYQTPKLIVLDINGFFSSAEMLPECQHAALDTMKCDSVKARAVARIKEMNPDESIIGYYLYIYQYHDRWENLKLRDFKYFSEEEHSCYKGFATEFKIGEVTMPDTDQENGQGIEFPGSNKEYMDKIVQLCNEQNIELLIVNPPSTINSINKETSLGVKKYTDENNVVYLDYNYDDNLKTAIDIDWRLDSMDIGVHLNYYGFKKFFSHFSNYINDNYKLTDYRDSEYSSQWDRDYEQVKKEIDENIELNKQNYEDLKNHYEEMK